MFWRMQTSRWHPINRMHFNAQKEITRRLGYKPSAYGHVSELDGGLFDPVGLADAGCDVLDYLISSLTEGSYRAVRQVAKNTTPNTFVDAGLIAARGMLEILHEECELNGSRAEVEKIESATDLLNESFPDSQDQFRRFLELFPPENEIDGRIKQYEATFWVPLNLLVKEDSSGEIANVMYGAQDDFEAFLDELVFRVVRRAAYDRFVSLLGIEEGVKF